MIMAQEKYEYRYWFDTSDKAACIETSNNREFHIEIDTSPLQTGLHSFNCQIIGGETGESTVKTAFFYKIPSYSNGNCVIYVDGQLYSKHPISRQESSMIHIELDVDSLALGIHSLGIQVIDDSGNISSISESFFMKIATWPKIESMNIYYIIDNNQRDQGTCTVIDGIFHAELDMGSLSEGEHTITFLLIDSEGTMTQMETASFIKETSEEDNPNAISIINSDRIPDNTPIYNPGGEKNSKITPGRIYIQNNKKFITR